MYTFVQCNRILFTALISVYTVNPQNLFGTACKALRLRELLHICVKASDSENTVLISDEIMHCVSGLFVPRSLVCDHNFRSQES